MDLIRTWKKVVRISLMLAVMMSLLATRGLVAYAEEGDTLDPPTAGEEAAPAEEESDIVPEEGDGEIEPAPACGTESEEVDTCEVAEEAEPDVSTAETEALIPTEENATTETGDVESEAISTDTEEAEVKPEVVVEAMDIPIPPDPQFCPVGEVYNGPTCSPNQISFALALNDAQFAGGDGTIFVEPGNFVENVDVNGADWLAALNPIPNSFAIQSLNGSAVTTITGSLVIQNMFDFLLQGVTVTGSIGTDGVTADSNTGTLTLQDVVADNTSGNGITVDNHDGEVVLDNVQANNNPDYGAYIDNTGSAGSEGVTVTDSTFNDNNTPFAGNTQAGLEVHSDGAVTLNNVEASGNLDGDGAFIEADGVTVNDSTFNDNTNNSLGYDGYGHGLEIQSSGGPIELNNVTANNNEESGADLWFQPAAAGPANTIDVNYSHFKYNGEFGVYADPEGGTATFNCVRTYNNTLGNMVPVGEKAVWIACPPCKPDGKHDKKEANNWVWGLLSTEEPTTLNAGNGVLVTYPPIVIIDEESVPNGKVKPLKEYDLPAPLPPDDTFMAGVHVTLINAEIPDPEDVETPEDAMITVEFWIPGHIVDNTFMVLWWDEEAGEAGEWVTIPHTYEPHPRRPGGKIVAQWPEPGIFVLVMLPTEID
jgi:hypothetical protein